MSMNLHYKYAVNIGGQWVSKDDKNKYCLSKAENKAETRWDVRGALGIQDSYLKDNWNVTMGDKPIMAVRKIHRPQRIRHRW